MFLGKYTQRQLHSASDKENQIIGIVKNLYISFSGSKNHIYEKLVVVLHYKYSVLQPDLKRKKIVFRLAILMYVKNFIEHKSYGFFFISRIRKSVSFNCLIG